MADYIVIGAGSAGAVVAARLSEESDASVVLLEAGGSHRSAKIATPGLSGTLWRTPFDWGFTSAPQEGLGGRRVHIPRGKVLGGSSCLNYMIYIRGHRDNFDGWRDEGNAGWGYRDVLPLFKRSERNARGADEFHGGDGPLHVTSFARPAAVTSALVQAAAEVCKVPVTDDFNGAEQEGAGTFQATIKDGRRCSTAVAFLEPAERRANLQIVTGALVERILIEKGRAVGVRYRRGDKVEEVRASREVVLCAGAIGSPQILMLSGVGPAHHLRALGIEVSVDLPGVGQNLQEHAISVVSYAALGGSAPKITPLRGLMWMAQAALGRRGPLTSNWAEGGAFVKVGAAAARPDMQFHFVCSGVSADPNTDEKNYTPTGAAFTIVPTLLYPQSRGEVRLTSADPAAKPVVDPRLLADPADFELLFDATRLANEIAHAAPMRDVRGANLIPRAARDASRDDLVAEMRVRGNTLFHPVGTCRMGNDERAVVDAELRVRGVDGLRVADASIMPTIVGGNTNAACIMIGEKAAELVRHSRRIASTGSSRDAR